MLVINPPQSRGPRTDPRGTPNNISKREERIAEI
jgi:hypothetical protein